MNNPIKSKATIAFLGTGLMGAPMCQNILKHGFSLRCWNRTLSKARPLEALGALVQQTPEQVVSGADVIISMLSDGPSVLEVIRKEVVLDALKESAIWVDMSSTKPKEAQEQTEILGKRGVSHLDAPVSGGTKGAEAGDLAIMAGGYRETFEQATDCLSSMGRPVYVGPSGSGQLAKLANQTIVGITIGAVAEAMYLLEKGGADPVAVRNALRGGFADSKILQQHGARMSMRDFDPGGPSKIQLKDLNNVLEIASQLNLTLPSTEHVRDRYAVLVNDMGRGDVDHSGLFLELEAKNIKPV